MAPSFSSPEDTKVSVVYSKGPLREAAYSNNQV